MLPVAAFDGALSVPGEGRMPCRVQAHLPRCVFKLQVLGDVDRRDGPDSERCRAFQSSFDIGEPEGPVQQQPD
jgi:hypothetical protein